ncbi:SDR family NAD(P)-dependent oxidoreductase [Nonomuraea sp. NPDC048882]|uniref:SDR family NAD(P)-dependent oxidoreductase n=1 Tax=Nonomuraea sp. NPDC048882 TaxID=3154347 RepID=UPI0033DCE506
MSGLREKVVIVTGGARGIGAAVATRMARDGATVVVSDLLDGQGAKTASKIQSLFLRHDVTSQDDWKSVVEATVERYGRVDGLVNNAGIAAGLRHDHSQRQPLFLGRTTFVARYLRDRDLQREIEEGLNVVEAWNRANSVICYGRGGAISTNRRDEVEMTALCLRILQASLVMVNVLMLQDVLAEPEWAACSPRSIGSA